MKVKDIVSKMSLKEKISFCTGAGFWDTKKIERLDVPSIMMSDGPHGLRCQKGDTDMVGVNDSLPATCFPTAVTAGATWNPELYAKEGEAIGKEALSKEVSIVLGPGCNIKRNPLGGRNFEYISEDPFLAGKMAATFVRGQQETGVSSCLKHFAANSQEYKRMNGDSQMDERTLREIYLAPFEIAVKEGKPETVMCAYNKINGDHCSDNKTLLNDILRDEWGFEGTVITDWGAMNDRIKGFQAGCDLNMPGGSDFMEEATLDAVRNGILLESDIDRSVERILRLVEKAKSTKSAEVDYEAHHNLARRIAEEGAVLLKNEDEILPLSEKDAVIIGYMAKDIRYQGSGSSHINPYKLTNLIDAMKSVSFVSCCDKDGNVTDEELKEAVEASKSHNVAIVVAGLPEAYESEALDRDHMSLPEGHTKMIEAVASANPNTVVVLLGGSIMELPWGDKVKAILYMGLPGEAGGEAIADILRGKVNPSGKLTETWPLFYSDVISKDTFGKRNVEYREGIYVGYRYYDKAKKKVRYPFGHGLSYTTFKYSGLKVEDRKVSVTITNTGKIKGSEVVQLYIAPPKDGIFRPEKELKGFKKVELKPGESITVDFELDDRSFAIWNDGWRIPEGIYKLQIGSSSRDIREEKEISVTGERLTKPTWQEDSWYDTLNGEPSRKEWEELMGHPVAIQEPEKKGTFTMDNSCFEMKDDSFVMKIQYMVTKSIVSKQCGTKDPTDPQLRMMLVSATDCPLRASVINSTGKMSDKLARGLLEMANGHFIKGLKCICIPKRKEK
ncbi:MAG: glycoside hydrolase family 3 C-terminal domain-containing protein [Candidatus Ornithospirochaeta sp.]